MSQVEIRQLRTLVALRETGSLVEASERMFLTQSLSSMDVVRGQFPDFFDNRKAN